MMSLDERCQNYFKTFPNWPPPTLGSDGRISGMWILGQNYQSKRKYYGEYPPNYLKRVMTLFPDVVEHSEILHLFSGVVTDPGVKFDINPDLNPDIVGDAHQLASYFPANHFQLILADPDYTKEDAAHHGTPLINRNKVVKECVKILKPMGFLCWLDQVWPMFSKAKLALIGVIGIIRSTNHRVRVLFMFQKVSS